MYTVWMTDDACGDEMMVFEGTLADCLAYVGDDDEDGLYIQEPDGFTVYEP